MNKFSMPDWSAAFQDFQQKVSGLVGEAPRAEMEKHFRSAVSAALERMDLVTREELEQQQEALLRAKQKLAELEARLNALQPSPSAKKTDSHP